MGAFTVAVGAYCRNAGMNWGKPPADLPIPSVANCIVAWHPGKAPSEQAQQELRMVEQWQQRIGAGEFFLGMQPSGLLGGKSRCRVRGGCCRSCGGRFSCTLAAQPSRVAEPCPDHPSAPRDDPAAQRHLKKRHKGFCRGRWLNPNIPLAHTGVVAAAEPPQNVRQ